MTCDVSQKLMVSVFLRVFCFVLFSWAGGYSQKELSDAMKAKIRAEYLAVGGSPDQPLRSNYFLNIIVLIGALALLSSLVINNTNVGF